MGGQGSGRPPSVETIIARGKPPETPIGTGIYLPNYSGLQNVKKTDTPVNTSTNYYISGSVVADSDKVDGEHASAFEDANTNIQTHVTGTGSPHTWAGINKTVSSIADITTKSHTALSDIGTNTHAQIDAALGVKSKTKSHERVMTAASADIAYTGYGFQPTSLDIFSIETSTEAACWGVSDSAAASVSIGRDFDGQSIDTEPYIIFIRTSAGNYQFATVKSYDSDGFTLTWTKTGSPTATIVIKVRALR